MATSTFAFAASGVCALGYWDTGTDGAHSYRSGQGTNGRIDFTATGTALTLLCRNLLAGSVTVTVDGGTPVSLPLSGWGSVSVFSGLPDAAHTVSIQSTTNGGFLRVDSTSAFTLTGAAPALSYTAGFGRTYQLDGSLSSYVHTNTAWDRFTSFQGYNAIILRNFGYADATIRFRGAFDTLKVWGITNTFTVRLEVDGVLGPPVAFTGSSSWNLYTVATGLDPTTPHTYALYTVYSFGGPQYAAQLVTTGGTGIDTSTAVTLPARTLGALGDSLTAGSQANDSSLAYLLPVCRPRGFEPANYGISGTTVKQFASGAGNVTTSSGQARAAALAALRPAPTDLFILYGVNDAAQAGGAETAADFNAAYAAMLNTLTAGLPAGTRLWCLGILPVGSSQTSAFANRAAFNAQIQSVVTALASPSVRYVSTDAWINTTTYNSGSAPTGDLADGLHPAPQTGYPKVAAQVAALLAVVAATPDAFLPAHLRAPRGRTRVGPGVKTH